MENDELSAAFHLLQAGDLAAAEQKYRDILARVPNQVDAVHYLGLIQLQRGQAAAAEELLLRAIQLHPADASTYNHLGAAQAALGRLPDAAASFRRSIELNARDAHAHFNLGNALAQQAQRLEACESFRRAIQLQPGLAAAHFNLANQLLAAGQPAAAIESFESVLRLQPGNRKAQKNLANALFMHADQQSDAEQAVSAAQRAVRLTPESAVSWARLGTVCARCARHDDAVHAYSRAIELNSQYAEALLNRGVSYCELGRLAEAVQDQRQVLRIRPDSQEAHVNLGIALSALGHHEEAIQTVRRAQQLGPGEATPSAIEGVALAALGRKADAQAAYRRALELDPEHIDASYNLGLSLQLEGRRAEALACFNRVLSRQRDHAEARTARAMLWLAEGDFERGWTDYEWRWKCREFTAAEPATPRWDGSQGGTILLCAEQGFGDTFQFIRYAALVKQRAARVLLECPRRLVPILSSCRDLDQVICSGDERPSHDAHLTLMSLPKVLGTTIDTIPADCPYLFAAGELVEQWRQRLSEYSGYKIGVCWHANPEQRQARAFPLSQLERLAGLAGVQLISLQKRDGLDQLVELRDQFPIVDLGDEFDEAAGAFMDTAAVMQCLDLVIACDSAVAHLAGALNVPAWLALTRTADWRWLLDRTDSPWYPQHGLFRQASDGDWATVFDRMADAVRQRQLAGRETAS